MSNQENQQVRAALDAAMVALERATDLQSAAIDAGDLIAILQAGIVSVSIRRRLAVRGLHASGNSYQRIGDMLGLSKAGVVAIDKG